MQNEGYEIFFWGLLKVTSEHFDDLLIPVRIGRYGKGGTDHSPSLRFDHAYSVSFYSIENGKFGEEEQRIEGKEEKNIKIDDVKWFTGM